MKAKRLGMVLLLAASVVFAPSCKKKSEDPQPEEETPVTPVVTSGTFTAKVDGVAKSYAVNYYLENSGMVAISGMDATGSTGISLSLFTSKVGSYDVDGMLTQANYLVGGTAHSGTSGKIVITNYENNKISGTFSFVKTGGVSVTEGVFKDVPKK